MKLISSNTMTKEEKKDFSKLMAENNLKIGKLLMQLVIFFEIIILIYSIFIVGSFNKIAVMYIFLYSILFIVSIIFLLLIKKHKFNYVYLLMIIYCIIIIIWASCISFLDILHSDMHSFVYLTVVMGISGFLIIDSKTSLILYTTSFILYFTLASFIAIKSFNVNFFLNLLVFTVFAYLISYNKFKTSYYSYKNQKIILKNMDKLKIMNEIQLETNEKLKLASCTDALTGINNRWGLHYKFDNLLNECYLNQKNLSVMMFDLDNFKGINDNYGHKAGDESLIKIAEIFKRNVDLNSIFRYGGEEFIVILTGLKDEDSYNIANKIRNEIEYEEKNTIKLTISGGIYTKIPEKDSDSDEYLIGADKALYQAKTGGKNKIIMFSY